MQDHREASDNYPQLHQRQDKMKITAVILLLQLVDLYTYIMKTFYQWGTDFANKGICYIPLIFQYFTDS